MKRPLKALLSQLPLFRQYFEARRELLELQLRLKYHPGHFYSPYPDLAEVEQYRERLFDRRVRELADIDLGLPAMTKLLESFADYQAAMPFRAQQQEDCRYYFDNPAYAWNDGFTYYSMLSHLKPERVIEVGIGMSSCLLLDYNEKLAGNAMDILLIDPYPEKFLERIDKHGIGQAKLRRDKIQEVPLEAFSKLGPNDILFIDSSHVSKCGSDFNYILFEILPSLAEGVCIHFHDLLWPFEYSEAWIKDHCAWNEAYLMRAFLMNNRDYAPLYWNHYMSHAAPELYARVFPNYEKDLGGALWIRKCEH